MNKIDLIELDGRNFTVAIDGIEYSGKFNYNSKLEELEIIEIFEETDPETNCINLINPLVLVQVEETIEEFGFNENYDEDSEYVTLNFA